jgi:RNA polymerase sigma factor (sigma-70 family)
MLGPPPARGCRDLLTRCAKQRDEPSWIELLSCYRGALLAGIRRARRRAGRVAASAETEDLLQEVYVRLLDQGGRSLLLCRGGEERSVAAYLRRVAENVALDQLRAGSAAKRRPARSADALLGEPMTDDLAQAAGGQTPEELLLSKERRRLFVQGAAQAAGGGVHLAPGARRVRRSRDLFVLGLALEGLSSREIAERLGGVIAPSSVDSVIHRLRRRLAKEGMALPRRARG